MRKELCILVGGILIAVFLGACSSSQQASNSSSSGDDVLWLETPPQCEFTEVTQISGQYRNSSTMRSDRLSGLRHVMLEKAQKRGGDAVIKVSITPAGGDGGSSNSVFEYKGRVILFEESSCRE